VAVKREAKREARREHNPVSTRSEEAAEIAHTLAPLEEQEGSQEEGARQRRGAIIVDTAQLNLPKDFIEEETPAKGFGLEPVVLFILIFFVAFIAFIAYLISLEPQK
jgi:hypothetical protein